jgi:hypothetical protein
MDDWNGEGKVNDALRHERERDAVTVVLIVIIASMTAEEVNNNNFKTAGAISKVNKSTQTTERQNFQTTRQNSGIILHRTGCDYT